MLHLMALELAVDLAARLGRSPRLPKVPRHHGERSHATKPSDYACQKREQLSWEQRANIGQLNATEEVDAEVAQ